MKKLSKNDILILVVVFIILIYVGVECYSVTHVSLKTQTAVTTTVYDKIDAKAIVVRQEQPIQNASSGVTVPCLTQGDKASVNGNVAMTFTNSNDAQNYLKYLDVQSQLDYYNNLESQTMGHAVDVKSINNEISSNINDYIRSIYSGDTSKIQQQSAIVNDSIVRRQLIIGEDIDFTSILTDLRKQSQTYASSVSKPNSYITTDQSGVFSTYTDGYENLIDYNKVTKLTINQVNTAIKTVEKSSDENKQNNSQSQNVGKLITGYNWYYLVVVDSDKVKNLTNGQDVEIALKDSADTVLKVQIVSGAQPKADEKQTVLVLKSNELNGALLDQRLQDIEIRYQQYTGVKMPVDAVHVVDGKKGVYALVSSKVTFRQADVIYSNNNYVLLEYDKDNKDGIRLYDKIILQGKELEDGKVYTR